MNRKWFVIILSLTWGSLFFPGNVLAQEYPTREIELIIASRVGSNSDNGGRLAARFGEKHLGKPIVPVNKAGGEMAIGFTALAQAKPDGYTLGLTSNAMIALPHTLKGVSFHYKKSYRHIAQFEYSSQALFVKKDGPWDISLAELIKRMKAKPDTIKCGIHGHWTSQDFARELFEQQAGVKFLTVRITGKSGNAVTSLLGGHLDINCGPASEWSHLYKADKVSVLAISTEQRDPRFPNIPTFRELGFDVVIGTYHWVSAPAATPDWIINILSEAFKKAFSDPAFMEAADHIGNTGGWTSSKDAMKTMERVDQMYQAVAKKYGLKPK